MAAPLEVLTDEILAMVRKIDPTAFLVEKKEDPPGVNRLTLANAKYDGSAGRPWMVDIDIDATSGFVVRLRTPSGLTNRFDMTESDSTEKLEAALRRLCNPK